MGRRNVGAWLVSTMLTLMFLLIASAGAVFFFGIREHASLRDSAAGFAAPALRKRGIVELASNCVVSREGDQVSLRGSGLDNKGAMHSFVVLFRVAEFGDTLRWKIEYLTVDGHIADDF